jgi:hypothetical protein
VVRAHGREQDEHMAGVTVVNARRIVFNGLAQLRNCVAARWSQRIALAKNDSDVLER